MFSIFPLLAILSLAVLVVAPLVSPRAAEPTDMVVIAPGEDIQAIIDAHLPGTSYLLLGGVHRQQSIEPKDGDSFIGEAGAHLSGAVILGPFAYLDGAWRASAPRASAKPTGKCAKNGRGNKTEICTYLEDLFVDSVPLRRVASGDYIGSGAWFFDDERGQVVMADDPRGRLVELSLTHRAFFGAARNVIISGLVIEKYAAPAQSGAIQGEDGAAWTVRGNEIRLNHGAGIRTGAAMRIVGNRIHRNGQIGLVGDGDNIQIEDNVVARNNYAGFSTRWEAGGAKLVKTTNLVVRGNCVHDNIGTGLWTDIGNIHALYEGNRVFANSSEGIHHEISYDAVIRNNIVFANGHGYDSWLFGAQILVNTSRDVEVYGNHVEVARGYGDGIILLQQDRGDGRYGERRTSGNRVRDNLIVYRGNNGISGAAGDYANDALFSAGNLFNHNRYRAIDIDHAHWAWGEAIKHRARYRTWQQWRAAGQEPDGELDIRYSRSLEPRCGGMPVGPEQFSQAAAG
jgi:hypothetical protein